MDLCSKFWQRNLVVIPRPTSCTDHQTGEVRTLGHVESLVEFQCGIALGADSWWPYNKRWSLSWTTAISVWRSAFSLPGNGQSNSNIAVARQPSKHTSNASQQKKLGTGGQQNFAASSIQPRPCTVWIPRALLVCPLPARNVHWVIGGGRIRMPWVIRSETGRMEETRSWTFGRKIATHQGS